MNEVTSQLTAQALSRLQECLQTPATPEDEQIVEAQLGRFPRGMVAVGARCIGGEPLAVITRPLVEGHIPFPTSCYLTNPQAVKAASHLEAQGVMKEYNDMLAQDESLCEQYQRAHEVYLAFRHALAQEVGDEETHIEGISAGGMPVRVKCLHALVAQSLVMGPGVNPIGDMALDAMKDEFDPQICRCE